MLRKFALSLCLAILGSPVYAMDYVVLQPNKTRSNEVWYGMKPIPGEHVPDDVKVMAWVIENDENGRPDTDISHYADLGVAKGFKRFIPDAPAPAKLADVDGFFDAMIRSGKFSQEEILQGIIASKVKDDTARNALILQFAANAAPERQAELADLVKQFNINLPLEGK